MFTPTIVPSLSTLYTNLSQQVQCQFEKCASGAHSLYNCKKRLAPETSTKTPDGLLCCVCSLASNVTVLLHSGQKRYTSWMGTVLDYLDSSSTVVSHEFEIQSANSHILSQLYLYLYKVSFYCYQCCSHNSKGPPFFFGGSLRNCISKIPTLSQGKKKKQLTFSQKHMWATGFF